ncbi:hypothetical protein ID854_15220 [Xenorhabdus sp. M]|uniref:Uncharacterized protein n=1 Tax=Xenorhabdus szentirmaii TaxID=290112 RepID=A0AAW3YUJ2_9GAMM|nr:hypothetical protein [Xenorhabdus sp. M]MBD2801758.1 hypothetical protein [Xenorhabdus sp. M]
MTLIQSEKALSLKSAELERALLDVEKLENRISEMETKLKETSANLTRTQDHLEQAESEKCALGQRLAMTEEELDAQKGRGIEQTEKIRAVQEQNIGLKEQLEKEQTRQAQIQDSLITAKAHGDSSDRECKRLTEEQERLINKLNHVEADVRALVQKKGTMAGQLQERERQAKLFEEKYAEALSKISKLEQDLEKSVGGTKSGKGDISDLYQGKHINRWMRLFGTYGDYGLLGR